MPVRTFDLSVPPAVLRVIDFSVARLRGVSR